jgi:ribosome maturation factor RimP
VTSDAPRTEQNNVSTTQRVGLTDTGSALVSLIEPTLASIGFELAHLELEGSGQQILRVFIDSPNGVTINDCAKASRHMSAMLDVEDPIASAYSLEVSSPGVDRPLGRVKDWHESISETVAVKTIRSIEGRSRWTGTLRAVTEDTATVEVDGQEHHIPLDFVQKANLKYSFDKPRTGESSR